MPEESIRSQVESQARQAILEHALLRVENAVIIAGTLLATFFVPQPFPWWPVWGWAVVGLLGLAGMIASSLGDSEANRQVVAGLYLQRFDTRGITDRDVRVKLDQALDYYKRIQTAIDGQGAGILQDRLGDTVRQINDWLANMFQLARRLDTYRQDKIIRRDMDAVPREVTAYKERLRREDNPSVAQQMQAAIAARETQLQALGRLQDVMEKAEFQLEQSLAALGTIYPQMQLIGARDVDSSRTQRLQADIADQVHALDDLVTSINEVYDYESVRSDVTPAARAPEARRAAGQK